MLTRRTIALVMCVLTLALVTQASAVAAGGPVTCPPPSVLNPYDGTCQIIVTDPGGGGGSGGGGAGGPTKPVGNSPAKCVSRWSGAATEVQCTSASGYWSNGRQCYIRAVSPQPARTDPVWGGHVDGTVYLCDPPVASAGGQIVTYFWAAAPPQGPAAPPDPRALASRAVASMRLHAIAIGIVPEPRSGSVGIIGLPTWMWAATPDAQSLGPLTRTATAGGFTVTATAKADRTVWTMGDGATVSCRGPGTPYADSHGKQPSPSCGHTYTKQGTYAVRATTYWVVTWTGIGQTGTIPLAFTATTTITMGEAQVLNG